MYVLVLRPTVTLQQMSQTASPCVQGVRIQLNSASLDWAKATLKNLQAAQRACGAFASVVLETVGPELAVKAPEDTKEITFEPGTPVTLTRDTRKAFSASVVPVHCEAAFTSLQLKRDAILRVSTFLAAGAAPLGTRVSCVLRELIASVSLCRACQELWRLQPTPGTTLSKLGGRTSMQMQHRHVPRQMCIARRSAVRAPECRPRTDVQQRRVHRAAHMLAPDLPPPPPRACRRRDDGAHARRGHHHQGRDRVHGPRALHPPRARRYDDARLRRPLQAPHPARI